MKLHETFIKPMHKEGWRFVGAFGVLTLLLFFIWMPLFLIGLVLTIWCYYFFRDPVRHVPDVPGLIVSPADGIVSLVEWAAPPPELGLGDEKRLRVSVFMSVFNCHINRAPVPGRVAKMAYKPGKFLSAELDKASEDNERNSLLIEMDDGRDLVVTQIAGLVARRIVPLTEEGAVLKRGERFGLIRFGSRLDTYLPEGVVPLVDVGQTMVAGETVLADMAQTSPRPARAD
ncbi:phosphatidylserine decarboxylase [Vannielia litorea]|uniref:Phosphatidylserine decarboxylase proenzyme n=1 Tax=Vannielia litorea TaxID=1217970 RepID=A0A1N6EHG1_9RHOB|nr:phosphatidylserine decarboxylase [Vannielia litorea]SIN82475.1 phosphatidylserine decarboxylase [Vannielia litorea]